MAHAYSRLFGIKATGLRFFSVYGEYGRPDMACFLFTKKILGGEPITVFNNGDLYRDFTYIDDIVDGIAKLIKTPAADYKIYNLGNNHPVKLSVFIETLEKALGVSAVKEFLPMQPGDVYKTYADISAAQADFGFNPSIGVETGIARFVKWYRGFYKA